MYEYKLMEVLRVVDGDTVDCVISLGFGVRGSFRFRLVDVNAPEIYGARAEPAGAEAKAYVESWFSLAQRVVVVTYKGSGGTTGIGDGAFGRWLADFIDGTTGQRLSTAMAEMGYTR